MITLTSATLSMTVDRHGRVTALAHTDGDTQFLLAASHPVGLWQLGLIRPASWTDPLPPVEIPKLDYEGHEWWANRREYEADLVLDSNDFNPPELTPDKDGLTLAWRIPAAGGEVRLTVRCDAAAERPGIELTPIVCVPEGWAVKWLVCPRIRGFGDAAEAEGDALLYPENFGVLHRNPLADMTWFTGQYPGAANWCQMTAWLHGDAGVLISIRDPESNHTGIDAQYVEGAHLAPVNMERWHIHKGTAPWIERAPTTLADRVAQGWAPAMQIQCRHWPEMTAQWECPYPVVVEGFSGGWFGAAQRHRAWAMQQRWCRRGPLHTRDDVPDACTQLDLWFARYGFHPASDTPTPAWEFRDAMRRLRKVFDMPFGVHWYHWHDFSWHSTFPTHAPPVEGFREVVEELQDSGVVVMPYCQGRMLYRDRETIDHDRRHATVEANGQPYLEMYTPQDDWPLALCPSDPWSAEQWYEAARMLWDDYGVEGVYFDQITAMPPSLCYHAGHGHPLGGGNHYWRGYDHALAEMEPLRSSSPERFLSSELLSDAFLDRIDLYLCFVPVLEDYVPLFPAIYGDYTMLMGRSTPREVMENPALMALCQGEQFLFGAQLGWMNDEILDVPAAAHYLRDLARLRSRVREILNVARLVAPPRVECRPHEITLCVPGTLCGRGDRDLILQRAPVRATAWEGPTGERLLLLLNEASEAATAVVALPSDWQDAEWTVWYLGDDVPHTMAGGSRIQVTLEPFAAAAVLWSPRSPR